MDGWDMVDQKGVRGSWCNSDARGVTRACGACAVPREAARRAWLGEQSTWSEVGRQGAQETRSIFNTQGMRAVLGIRSQCQSTVSGC